MPNYMRDQTRHNPIAEESIGDQVNLYIDDIVALGSTVKERFPDDIERLQTLKDGFFGLTFLVLGASRELALKTNNLSQLNSCYSGIREGLQSLPIYDEIDSLIATLAGEESSQLEIHFHDVEGEATQKYNEEFQDDNKVIQLKDRVSGLQ